MTILAPITPQLDASTRAAVTRLARLRGISDAEFVADAVKRATERDMSLEAGLQRGIEAADRGEVLSQAEMVEWFEQRVAARRRR